ncbi:MAG: hypothetical protein LBQ66_10320 [Planctomycetaceae bacterium]|nr:hypothetical protein [Planctomycetaceae bacterium]
MNNVVVLAGCGSGIRIANVRWATDCQAFLVNSVGDSRQPDRQNTSAKPKRQTFEQFGISTRFPPHCFRLAPLAENAIHQESPAVGCLPYVDNVYFYFLQF